MPGWRVPLAGVTVALSLTACALRQAPMSVYHSDKGYRVTLPGQDWQIAGERRADLELRHRQGRAGMLVNASCGSRLSGRSPDDLSREILAGFSARDVQQRGAARVAGREATHVVAEGRSGGSRQRVRVEMYVVKDGRCVYDLLYAAAPADFAVWREDFRRLVETFALE